MTDLNNKVINQLKVLRKEKGLSQDKLSELSGLDIKYINKLENGRFNLTLPTLERILKGLSINDNDFFKSILVVKQNSEEINVTQRINMMSNQQKEEFINDLIELVKKYECWGLKNESKDKLWRIRKTKI